MRVFLAVVTLLTGVYAAHAFGMGRQGVIFDRLGISPKKGVAAVVAGCASPTAPNGVVDLSQCSNAFYAAVVF